MPDTVATFPSDPTTFRRTLLLITPTLKRSFRTPFGSGKRKLSQWETKQIKALRIRIGEPRFDLTLQSMMPDVKETALIARGNISRDSNFYLPELDCSKEVSGEDLWQKILSNTRGERSETILIVAPFTAFEALNTCLREQPLPENDTGHALQIKTQKKKDTEEEISRVDII